MKQKSEYTLFEELYVSPEEYGLELSMKKVEKAVLGGYKADEDKNNIEIDQNHLARGILGREIYRSDLIKLMECIVSSPDLLKRTLKALKEKEFGKGYHERLQKRLLSLSRASTTALL